MSLRNVIEFLVAVAPNRLPAADAVAACRKPAANLHLVGLLLLLAASHPARATDHGQLGPTSPDIKAWAGSLENKLKEGCCATADGWKPEAVEYDTAGNHYRVRIEGEWYDVPIDAVLDVPNKFGFAVVWYYRTYLNGEKSTIFIRCFLPGAGG